MQGDPLETQPCSLATGKITKYVSMPETVFQIFHLETSSLSLYSKICLFSPLKAIEFIKLFCIHSSNFLLSM